MRKKRKKQRGTSLAISRLLFRFAIPAESPPTDSNRLTPTDSDGCENRRKSANIYENAERQKHGHGDDTEMRPRILPDPQRN